MALYGSNLLITSNIKFLIIEKKLFKRQESFNTSLTKGFAISIPFNAHLQRRRKTNSSKLNILTRLSIFIFLFHPSINKRIKMLITIHSDPNWDIMIHSICFFFVLLLLVNGKTKKSGKKLCVFLFSQHIFLWCYFLFLFFIEELKEFKNIFFVLSSLSPSQRYNDWTKKSKRNVCQNSCGECKKIIPEKRNWNSFESTFNGMEKSIKGRKKVQLFFFLAGSSGKTRKDSFGGNFLFQNTWNISWLV